MFDFKKLKMQSQIQRDDVSAYTWAAEELKHNPVKGPHGTYHVKNGIIHYGYHVVGSQGFATSEHFWNIMH